MLDQRILRVDEHHRAPIVAAQRGLHRPRQRDAPRFAAQRERREGLVDVGDRIDVEGAERGERVARFPPGAEVDFGAPGDVDAAEVGERPARRRAQLDDVVGDDEIHHARPSTERPTIILWISMVPDATVAACAYRQWSSTAPCSAAPLRASRTLALSSAWNSASATIWSACVTAMRAMLAAVSAGVPSAWRCTTRYARRRATRIASSARTHVARTVAGNSSKLSPSASSSSDSRRSQRA